MTILFLSSITLPFFLSRYRVPLLSQVISLSRILSFRARLCLFVSVRNYLSARLSFLKLFYCFLTCFCWVFFTIPQMCHFMVFFKRFFTFFFLDILCCFFFPIIFALQPYTIIPRFYLYSFLFSRSFKYLFIIKFLMWLQNFIHFCSF